MEPLHQRPCFDVNDQKFVSAGIILYCFDSEGRYYFMLQQIHDGAEWGSTWDWEDFGGKSDPVDKSIEDVAVRECVEELNFQVDRSFIATQIATTSSFRYEISECKYMLYIVNVPVEYMTTFSTELFGEQEVLTGIKRTVHWIGYDELVKLATTGRLHPRLRERVINLVMQSELRRVM